MDKTPEIMTFERFMAANTSHSSGPDEDYLVELVNKSNDLLREGVLKLTNFSILVPFVAMGGSFEDLLRYYSQFHQFDPSKKWKDWEAVKKELSEVFEKYFC